MKGIPIGKTNFKVLIEENYYYVDKTKVIEELLIKRSEVVLFTRPRRFGKSLFLSMLDNFFDIDKKESNKNLFDGLYISKSKYFEHFGKYPVIRLDFKDIKGDTYEDIRTKLINSIRKLYINKKYVKKCLCKEDKLMYDDIMLGRAEKVSYETSVQWLTEWLEKYHKEKVIILVDEYDAPIQEAYSKGFYDNGIDLFKRVLSSALKDNASLKMGILTGVLRVSKESMFSDLNNLVVDTMVYGKYNDAFGFTSNETKEMLEHFDLELTKEITDYYDGYTIGGVHIYNPWDIINFVYYGELNSYWFNTSRNELIKELFRRTEVDNKFKIQDMLEAEFVDFPYNEQLTFTDLNDYNDVVNIYNLLFASGYLTFDRKEENKYYFKIPNKEVREELKKLFRRAILVNNVNLKDVILLIEDMLNGNANEVEIKINQLLNSLSYYDVNSGKEFSYHMYMMQLLGQANGNGFIVKSNRESGLGRPDIMIETYDRKRGAVIEIKIAKSEEEIEKKLEEAKKQIEEKQYAKELELDGIKEIKKYALVFYKKICKFECLENN